MTHSIGKRLQGTFTALVLVGVATAAFSCAAGEVGGEEPLGVAEQGYKWEGGCACLPEKECPSVGAITVACKYPASQGKEGLCALTELRCAYGEVACYVVKDGMTCTSAGKIGTCDGGYCGTCPSCYYEKPYGVCADGNTGSACGKEGETCKDCDDSNECTTDTCSTLLGCSFEKRDRLPCTGGTCAGDTCCTGCILNGACIEGVKPDACGTGGANCAVCNDGNACTTDTCVAGACGTIPTAKGTSCADADRCDGTETCDGAGTCVAGSAVVCTSSDPCFASSCSATTGTCVRTALPGNSCNDGNTCTEVSACDASGSCIGASPKNCDDGNQCTTDSCDPATGCTHVDVTNGTGCGDGTACTSGWTCQNGACQSSGGISCDDGNPCTLDSYDCASPVPACVHAATNEGGRCLSDNLCLANTTCQTGSCQGGTALSCDDYNPCTDDSCDSVTGGCQHVPAVSPGACSDGNPCTENDRCSTGTCAGTARICAPLDECHVSGTCNVTSGACENDPRKADGEACADNKGTCQSGLCVLTAGTGGTSAGGASSVGGAGGATSGGAAGEAGANATGGKSASAEAGAAGSDDGVTGEAYKRNPGGCSCSLPSASRQGFGWLLLAITTGLGLRLGRRQRR